MILFPASFVHVRKQCWGGSSASLLLGSIFPLSFLFCQEAEHVSFSVVVQLWECLTMAFPPHLLQNRHCLLVTGHVRSGGRRGNEP